MLKTSISTPSRSIKNSAIEVIQWPSPFAISAYELAKKVLAIQTTRIAPRSSSSESSCEPTSAYQGFNLGLHVGDCAKQVENNRQLLQSLLPKNAKIQWFEQVHGNVVAEILQVSKKAIVADAAVTNKKNICLAIMTADCLPIVLVSKSGDEIAAIHGGWRPLSTNIITNTLAKMKTPAADIYAWLGPCISQNVFEVGEEVKSIFVQQDKQFNAVFTDIIKGKCFADLHKIARLQLESLGVNQISMLPECTYSNTDKYYSYRKKPTTGRMATLICLL